MIALTVYGFSLYLTSRGILIRQSMYRVKRQCAGTGNNLSRDGFRMLVLLRLFLLPLRLGNSLHTTQQRIALMLTSQWRMPLDSDSIRPCYSAHYCIIVLPWSSMPHKRNISTTRNIGQE